MQLELVKPGIKWQSRKGYHLDTAMNSAIPAAFRRPDGFYHWHMDSCIVGFFLLADTLETKQSALETMLLMHADACASFGLTSELLQVQS